VAARSELSELLAEIVRHFQAGIGSGVSTPPTLPAHLDNLDLVEAEWVAVAGRDLSVHRYADGVGHEVAVYRGLEAFEPPEGAELAGSGRWMLRTGAATLFYSDEPLPSLVVGRDPGPVLHAVTHFELAEDPGYTSL
jgi:hypothetical protein